MISGRLGVPTVILLPPSHSLSIGMERVGKSSPAKNRTLEVVSMGCLFFRLPMLGQLEASQTTGRTGHYLSSGTEPGGRFSHIQQRTSLVISMESPLFHPRMSGWWEISSTTGS